MDLELGGDKGNNKQFIGIITNNWAQCSIVIYAYSAPPHINTGEYYLIHMHTNFGSHSFYSLNALWVLISSIHPS